MRILFSVLLLLTSLSMSSRLHAEPPDYPQYYLDEIKTDLDLFENSPAKVGRHIRNTLTLLMPLVAMNVPENSLGLSIALTFGIPGGMAGLVSVLGFLHEYHKWDLHKKLAGVDPKRIPDLALRERLLQFRKDNPRRNRPRTIKKQALNCASAWGEILLPKTLAEWGWLSASVAVAAAVIREKNEPNTGEVAPAATSGQQQPFNPNAANPLVRP